MNLKYYENEVAAILVFDHYLIKHYLAKNEDVVRLHLTVEKQHTITSSVRQVFQIIYGILKVW